jgi:hypothetical protein
MQGKVPKDSDIVLIIKDYKNTQKVSIYIAYSNYKSISLFSTVSK